MSNLSIKDVPELWAERLRQLAARNHRSLQGELMAMVEKTIAAAFPGDSGAANADRPDKRIYSSVRSGTKTPEEVFAEMRAAGARPVRGQPLAVDIIRRDRDSR